MQPRRRVSFVVLPLVLLVGASIRLHDAHRGFWLDELITGWCVADGWGPILERSWICNLSPFFFWIEAAVSSVLGVNELALRLPSLAAGLAFLGLLYALLRRVEVAVVPALATTFLAAIDFYCVGSSLSARPYALLLFFSLGHLFCFYRLLFDPRPTRAAWLAYGFSHVACFYLHYTSIFALVWEALYLLPRAQPALRRKYLLACASIGAACLPAVPHLRYVAAKRRLLGPLTPGEIMNVMNRYNLDKYVLFPLLICLFLALLLRADRGAFASGAWSDGKRARLSCALFLYSGPMLAVWFLGKANIVQLSGYTLYCLPTVFVLFGLVLSELRRPGQIAFVAAAVFFVHTNWSSPVRNLLSEGDSGALRQAWREVVEEIRADAEAGDERRELPGVTLFVLDQE